MTPEEYANDLTWPGYPVGYSMAMAREDAPELNLSQDDLKKIDVLLVKMEKEKPRFQWTPGVRYI